MNMGARTRETGSKSRTKLGITLEQSAKEILAHLKGNALLPVWRFS
jgi:hypothetical protein